MAGKQLSKAYMAKEKKMHVKGGKVNAAHEKGESRKKKLAEKLMEKKMGVEL